MSVGMRMPLAKLYGMRRENTVTLKPRESATVLLNSIQRFFSERKLTDAKLVYHDKELFSCHKAVLSAFSSYFETLLAGTENCTVLSLDAVNPDNVEDLKYILQYMYGHTVTLHRNRVQHLLESAKIFGVTALHKTLEAQLVREMTHSQEQIGSTTGHSGKKKPPKPQSNNITVKPTAVASILLVSFQRFKSEQKFLDAKILAADVQLHTAHKLVLAAYSRYFESLLETTETLAILNLDEVDSVHVDLLKEILLYMYGHQVEIKESQIDSLISAARIFGVTSLSDGELSRIATKLRSGGTNLQSNSSGNATIYYQPSLGSVLQQNSVVEKPNRPVRSDYNFARTEPAAPSPPVSETSITGESQKETAKPIVLSSPIPSVMSRSLPLLTSVTNTSRIGESSQYQQFGLLFKDLGDSLTLFSGFYSMSSPSFSLSSGIDESLTLANVSDSFAMEEVIGGDETSPNSLYDTDHMIGSDIIGKRLSLGN